MPNILLVMFGGAFGAAARYLVGKATLGWFGQGYPWGTLAVNLIGGLLMGLLVGTLARFGQSSAQWHPLLAVGVLGGFTTFSAFSLEVVNMLHRGDWVTALGYVLVSVIGAVAAVALGMAVVRAVA